MLEHWIALARGPFLRLALLAMALGLLRQVALQVWEISWAFHRAGDQVVPWGLAIRRNLQWLLPWRYLQRRERRAYNFTSFLFHVGVIAVPLFLAGHVAIWRGELGIGWWTLPPALADWLSVMTVVAAGGLLAGRAAHASSRRLSRFQDWALPVLCIVPFVTGLGVAHPEWSPVGAQGLYLVHLLSAELLLVLVPFSKLVHMVLFWVSQTSTELGWRFPPGSGERVRLSLGKESEGV